MQRLSPVPHRAPLTDRTGILASVWDGWFRELFERVKLVKGETSSSGDENATISPRVYYHGVTTLTANRTLTLPACSECEDGHTIIVQDESGAAGTFSIAILRAGTDTVNGTTSVSIASNYGRRILVKRGTGWFAA